MNRSLEISSRYVRSRPLPRCFGLPSASCFDFQAALGVLDELAFHVAAQIEVAAMGDAFQLAELAGGEERKRVFDVGGADRVVAQLVLVVLAKPQALAGQAEARVPRHPPVAPVFVPLARRVRVAEELDLHLLELARAEREIPRRDLVAKALADLRDAERNLHPRAVEHVLEVDEDALGRFGPQEAASSSLPIAPTIVLNIRLNSRGSVRLHFSNSPGRLLGFCGHSADLQMVGPPAAFARPAIDHHVVKQIVVPRALPHLRVHDDRANRGRPFRRSTERPAASPARCGR